MSNKSALVKLTIRGNGHPDAEALSVPHQAESVGTVDIPDTTASGTATAIPFGSIGVGATLLMVKNTNNQDMMLTLNGSANLHRIPPGGVYLFAAPLAAGATPLTAASVKTTATQSGDGTVEYLVLGDPV